MSAKCWTACRAACWLLSCQLEAKKKNRWENSSIWAMYVPHSNKYLVRGCGSDFIPMWLLSPGQQRPCLECVWRSLAAGAATFCATQEQSLSSQDLLAPCSPHQHSLSFSAPLKGAVQVSRMESICLPSSHVLSNLILSTRILPNSSEIKTFKTEKS